MNLLYWASTTSSRCPAQRKYQSKPRLIAPIHLVSFILRLYNYWWIFQLVFSINFSVGTFRIISHYDAALYTARRSEMCDIVEVTFRYLADRPQVHSDVSGLPFMVIFCLHADFMLSSCCFPVLVMLVKLVKLVKLVMCSFKERALDLWSECIFSAHCTKICRIVISSLVWGSRMMSLSNNPVGTILIVRLWTCPLMSSCCHLFELRSLKMASRVFTMMINDCRTFNRLCF